ncbi:S41 family peptidase [Patescibacteria group bacterium]|nr:S41 family peptidase [Patescibacteria group bacterium]
MRFSGKNFFIFIFLISAILISFWFGSLVGTSRVECKICSPEDIDFSLFWEAYNQIQEKYSDPEDIDIKKIIYGAIAGMVKSIGDPYTVFFTPEEARIFQEDVAGVFEGVGMEVGIRKGGLTVISPLEGTPAQKAGIRAGDKIIKINDVLTADITIDEAISLIRGKKGTEVTLTVFREKLEETKEIKIIRGVIEIPSLELKMLENNIAYIKLYHFTERARFDFNEIAVEILNSPSEKIILDLRNNPGGFLGVSQDIAGWFLEKGEIVVIEDFGEGKDRKEYKAKGNGRLSGYPTVILINQGSASASEILAGALRDNRGIKLIGEKSFGKGSIQELIELKEGSSLKITIAKWLTPNGDFITDIGLAPDITVEMTEEDYNEGRDPQLDKAIEIIK